MQFPGLLLSLLLYCDNPLAHQIVRIDFPSVVGDSLQFRLAVHETELTGLRNSKSKDRAGNRPLDPKAQRMAIQPLL